MLPGSFHRHTAPPHPILMWQRGNWIPWELWVCWWGLHSYDLVYTPKLCHSLGARVSAHEIENDTIFWSEWLWLLALSIWHNLGSSGKVSMIDCLHWVGLWTCLEEGCLNCANWCGKTVQCGWHHSLGMGMVYRNSCIGIEKLSLSTWKQELGGLQAKIQPRVFTVL